MSNELFRKYIDIVENNSISRIDEDDPRYFGMSHGPDDDGTEDGNDGKGSLMGLLRGKKTNDPQQDMFANKAKEDMIKLRNELLRPLESYTVEMQNGSNSVYLMDPNDPKKLNLPVIKAVEYMVQRPSVWELEDYNLQAMDYLKEPRKFKKDFHVTRFNYDDGQQANPRYLYRHTADWRDQLGAKRHQKYLHLVELLFAFVDSNWRRGAFYWIDCNYGLIRAIPFGHKDVGESPYGNEHSIYQAFQKAAKEYQNDSAGLFTWVNDNLIPDDLRIAGEKAVQSHWNPDFLKTIDMEYIKKNIQ